MSFSFSSFSFTILDTTSLKFDQEGNSETLYCLVQLSQQQVKTQQRISANDDINDRIKKSGLSRLATAFGPFEERSRNSGTFEPRLSTPPKPLVVGGKAAGCIIHDEMTLFTITALVYGKHASIDLLFRRFFAAREQPLSGSLCWHDFGC
ncbi:hypothetical protein VTP01DRAFT_8320 [Rhizomucor pusillus]|uniref:uncharacterized protein n=1 Tax=Rhizomucor pusillus TaxID=4840 RepID=UPI003742AF1A